MQLLRPHPQFQPSYLDYIQELADEERYPFVLDLPHANFPALLRRLEEIEQGINLDEGYVPSSTYWLVEGQELFGVSNLRHYLNDAIRNIGGHIGLGIRPSRRGQGLGKALLNMTVQKAFDLGIRQVHIHCYQDNQASRGMIRSLGAELHSTVKASDHAVERYIIDLDPDKSESRT